MNDPRGSNWRIWDLHVHTPESIVHNYGSCNLETWEKFLCDLENLPTSIKVLGINDYIFIDGYRKIIEAKANSRLSNIDLILPVIEIRLDKFGGTDSRLSRVNFHIIFSDQIKPEIIQQQFINALPRSYKLSPEYASLHGSWDAVATKESLKDLGKKIIASVPEEERTKFNDPLQEGFNNLNFKLEDVLERLNSPYFKGKYVTAIGKTEWWNIKWNDRSIADKKTIINSANFVFIACESIKDYYKAKDSLRSAKVNDCLLDCSDAHSYSNSRNKDRIGNCFTWIKADPCFEGLKHVLVEPDEKIFVGEIPPQLETVENNKTKYISSVRIKKVAVPGKKLDEIWFDTDLSFNHGLVAIIGNKGSGKSALADIIGLLENSRNKNSFSFLNEEKFRKMPENRAQYFEGSLEWESDETHKKKLDGLVDLKEVERVKYIPQNYFEEICTQLGNIEETEFDKELKKVIFSHVGVAERLGQHNLDELIRYKTAEIEESIANSRLKLERVNNEIVDLERKLTKEYRDSLENQRKAKQAELAAWDKREPAVVKKPPKQDKIISGLLKKAEKCKKKLEEEIARAVERQEEVVTTIARVDRLTSKLENFKESYMSFREELEDGLSGLEIKVDEIITMEFNVQPLIDLRELLAEEKKGIERSLDKKNKDGLREKLKLAQEEIKGLQERMDKPSQEYEKYLENLGKWELRKQEIIGGPKKVGSLVYLKKQIENLDSIPEKLSVLYEKRRSYAKKIYKGIKKQKGILTELYAPVQRFIEGHPDIRNKITLNFDVSILNVGFEESFFDWINQSKTGSFMGTIDGRRRLDEILKWFDFNNEDKALAFADEIMDNLRVNKSIKAHAEVSIADQLKKGKTAESLFSFIYSFGYLKAKYMLRLGDKELKQLSPGERGALLIVFYLLVDLDTIPLVIDQPEHNLDNETVTKLLVPAIKKAKKRRQIIMITHNPILAVVCNADQVIVAYLDIKGNYKVEYVSGAIENPGINRRIVDILEGTMLAFDNRQRKYIREYLESYQENVWS